MTAAPPESLKQRDLVFTADPPGQAEHAFQLLAGLDGLRVERGSQPNSLHITYSLLDYALETLEQALTREGFRLEDTPLGHIGKKLTYYQEEVEYHNLSIPDPEHYARSRKSAIFVKAYEHHLHGDHDDTPPELREYK